VAARAAAARALEGGARRDTLRPMRAFLGIIIGALLTVCACGQAEDETLADETLVDVPADWGRVEAHCGYSFLAPPGVSVRSAEGTDSCIDVWTASGCMQRGDYGGFNSNLSEYVGKPEYVLSRESIHGREAKLVTAKTAEQGRIAVAHFPELDANGVTLTVWASCEDAAGQQAALTSFRTIILGP
jgi:hypothetical protein